MNKLITISIINVLFCTFMINFIRMTYLCNDLHIMYIFILYTIYAILLFVYHRWINKKVLPFFFKNKRKYDIISLPLSYTIVGVIFGRLLIAGNIFTYFIKLGQYIRVNEIDRMFYISLIVHVIIFLVISGMTIQESLDIHIKDIKNRWNKK